MWNLSHWKNASCYENSTQDVQSSLDPYALLKVRLRFSTLTYSNTHTHNNNTHSLLTSVAGIVMFKDVCELGFTEVLESQETEMSRYLATMFLAYCVMDLAIANVEYVNELDWESGGLHHVAYAVFCSYLLYSKQTMFFSVFLVEEIPTIYLSWKRIRGEKELKWTFATMFYLTRILYHSVATYALLEQSTICFAAGLVVLRQHMQWFGRWWTSQGMKLKQAQLTLKQKLAILCTMVVIQVGTHLFVSFRYWETPTMNSIRDNILHIGAYMYFTFKMITVRRRRFSVRKKN